MYQFCLNYSPNFNFQSSGLYPKYGQNYFNSFPQFNSFYSPDFGYPQFSHLNHSSSKNFSNYNIFPETNYSSHNSIPSNKSNLSSNSIKKKVEPKINYDKFDFKKQSRRHIETDSYISNLNLSNNLISTSSKFQKVSDYFKLALKRAPNGNFLGWKPTPSEPYKWMSYLDVNYQMRQIGSAIVNLGLKPNNSQIVGIFARNRPEWVITDISCSTFGYVSVPLYETLGPDAIPFILDQTQMSIAFCDDSDKAMRLLDSKSRYLKVIVVYDNIVEPKVQLKANQSNVSIFTFDKMKQIGLSTVHPIEPRPNDIYTICYTSGTTGLPKGVVLTHENMVSALNAVTIVFKKAVYFKFGEEVLLSYLPLAHMFERISQAFMMSIGGSIGFFQGDIKTLPLYLQELKPTFFGTVPRLLNRFKAQITQNLKMAPIQKQQAFQKAFELKKQEINKGFFNFNTPLDAAFTDIRNMFGGRLKLLVTGSAPISDEVMQFFKVVLGCYTLEGYGATETTAVSTIQIPGDNSIGHVGPPTVNCLFKLADVPDMGLKAKNDNKGEVLIKGSNIFKGYYKDPEKTREVLDKDGWYHTGDIGVITQNGCLKIVDRVKNIFKLQQGEYIAPEKIEKIYLESPFISQIFVYGDSLKNNLVAIVVPEELAVLAFAKQKNLNLDFKSLCKLPEVKASILEMMNQLGKERGLKGFELVKEIYLHTDLFSIQNGLLTPTLKSKRNELKNYFINEIKKMYQNLD